MTPGSPKGGDEDTKMMGLGDTTLEEPETKFHWLQAGSAAPEIRTSTPGSVKFPQHNFTRCTIFRNCPDMEGDCAAIHCTREEPAVHNGLNCLEPEIPVISHEDTMCYRVQNTYISGGQ